MLHLRRTCASPWHKNRLQDHKTIVLRPRGRSTHLRSVENDGSATRDLARTVPSRSFLRLLLTRLQFHQQVPELFALAQNVPLLVALQLRHIVVPATTAFRSQESAWSASVLTRFTAPAALSVARRTVAVTARHTSAWYKLARSPRFCFSHSGRPCGGCGAVARRRRRVRSLPRRSAP